jgi:hypothetical protein
MKNDTEPTRPTLIQPFTNAQKRGDWFDRQEPGQENSLAEKRLGDPIAFLQAIKKAPDAFTSGAFE